MTTPNLPPLPDPLEIDWPELHRQALGCGIEDRNIRDHYEAAEHGWQDGVDKAIERVPEQIFGAEQMQAYALAAYADGRDAGLTEAIEGVEKFYQEIDSDDPFLCSDTYHNGQLNALDLAEQRIEALKSDTRGGV